MKKLFLPILFLHLAIMVNAATYYFSNNSGDDSRSISEAQDPSTPWQTIDKLNSIMYLLQPGDQVLFKRGEIFNGGIIMTKSGTDDQPITFDAYGSGFKPVITGFTVLTGWTQVRDHVWETDFTAAGGATNMVVMNNREQAIGRFPNRDDKNGGYLNIDSHVGLTQLTSSQLPASPNWTGADIAIRKNRWTIDRSKVGYHAGTTIGFDVASTNEITDDYGFFIENSTNTLDENGEWYYDPIRHKLQMYFSDDNPDNDQVKASAVETVVSISFQNYITFNNLAFTGSDSYAFNLVNSNNITLNNCGIRFTGTNAVQALSSNNFTLTNSVITTSNNSALSLYWNCSNALIANNTIKNIAMIPGMGQSGNGTHQGVYVRGNNNLIQYNELDSCGGNGIHIEGDYSTVQNNFVNTFGFTIDDCGGIYTGQGLGDNTQYNSKTIANNIVINGIGATDGTDDTTYIATQGIYLDDNTNHVSVTGNTVANCGQAGIFNHNSTYTDIENNTMYNNGKAQFMAVRSINPISNVTCENNIMFSKTATQSTSRLESYYGTNNLPQLGTVDNNYYCRPIDDNYIFYDMYLANGSYVTSWDNLESWQKKFGFDAHSDGAPVTIPAFTATNATGVDIYPNGSYNTNIWNVSKFSSTGDINTTWNPNKLDGGTLQVTANNYSSSNNFYITLPTDNSVVEGQTYMLTFSLQGDVSGRPMTVYLRRQDSPNSDMTPRVQIPIESYRKEIQIAFTANTSARVSIEMDIAQPNGAIYVDNVMLQQANITYTNPDDYLLFAYNPSSDNKQVSLPDGFYYDATGKKYNNNTVLKPYTSIVLIKDAGQSLKQTTEYADQYINLAGNLGDDVAATTTSDNTDADLVWTVDNQKTTATSYEIERSADARTFTPLGTASVKKNSDATVLYQYTDPNPLGGKNYYRIKQVDSKGAISLSKVIMLNNISFRLNPNPARDVVHIVFDQMVSATDRLGKDVVIRDPSGKTVKTIQLKTTENVNQADVNVSSLQRGLYVLSITADGQSFSKTFLKL